MGGGKQWERRTIGKKDGVEEKRRSGRHDLDKDGEKKRGERKSGEHSVREKDAFKQFAGRRVEKRKMEIALGNIRERKTTQMLINT